MNPERFNPFSFEQIEPRGQFSDEVQEEQDRRRETHGALSREIREWWRGDAHAHSTESTRAGFENAEGIYTREEMAAYYEKLGLEFAAITEHASNPANPEVLTSDSAISQSLVTEAQNIAERNRESQGEFAIFSGVEASILFGEDEKPTLDVPADVLQQLDVVIASRHTIANEKDLAAIENSLTAAAEHSAVDVIGHPDRNLMADYDWAFFSLHDDEAKKMQMELKELQDRRKAAKEKPEELAAINAKLAPRYTLIKKVIGRQPFDEGDENNAELVQLRESFLALDATYLEMWDRVLEKMAQHHTAFEINFNAQPSQRIVQKAVAAGVPLFFNFDAHDFDRYKWQHTDKQKEAYGAKKRWAKGALTEEDETLLHEYKLDRLTHGPGAIPLLRLAHWIRRLKGMGATPDRVVNSSRDRMIHFLADERGKKTENLEVLKQKMEQKEKAEE